MAPPPFHYLVWYNASLTQWFLLKYSVEKIAQMVKVLSEHSLVTPPRSRNRTFAKQDGGPSWSLPPPPHRKPVVGLLTFFPWLLLRVLWYLFT